MPEIDKVSHRHDAIIDWLIANPTRPLTQCAQELGYTQAWLSVIVNSDAFQAEYHSRRAEVTHPELLGLQEKLHYLAHQSLNRLTGMVEQGKADDAKVLADVSDKCLSKLGYGVQKGGPGGGGQVNVQNNYYTQPVDRDALAQARSRMHQRYDPPEEKADDAQAALPNAEWEDS